MRGRTVSDRIRPRQWLTRRQTRTHLEYRMQTGQVGLQATLLRRRVPSLQLRGAGMGTMTTHEPNRTRTAFQRDNPVLPLRVTSLQQITTAR